MGDAQYRCDDGLAPHSYLQQQGQEQFLQQQHQQQQLQPFEQQRDQLLQSHQQLFCPLQQQRQQLLSQQQLQQQPQLEQQQQQVQQWPQQTQPPPTPPPFPPPQIQMQLAGSSAVAWETQHPAVMLQSAVGDSMSVGEQGTGLELVATVMADLSTILLDTEGKEGALRDEVSLLVHRLDHLFSVLNARWSGANDCAAEALCAFVKKEKWWKMPEEDFARDLDARIAKERRASKEPKESTSRVRRPKCFSCGQRGHIASQCRSQRRSRSRSPQRRKSRSPSPLYRSRRKSGSHSPPAAQLPCRGRFRDRGRSPVRREWARDRREHDHKEWRD